METKKDELKEKDVELTVSEIGALDEELFGKPNPSVPGMPSSRSGGILKLKLKIGVKFRLDDMRTQISPIMQNVTNITNELILEYGSKNKEGHDVVESLMDDPQGALDDKGVIKKIPNPKFQQFLDKRNELMEQKKTLKFPVLSFDEFSNLETDEDFPVLFKVIKEISKKPEPKQEENKPETAEKN